ncbi:MAG TPA: 30S ribosomal protein S8 [Desulfuromonadales bacterium]|nr:30S ribosomal protein S8 [Desulfuromonadales bacterium]
MSMTDPLADMITRIRNGGVARHQKVDIPSSNQKVAVATALKEQGYIKNFKTIKDEKQGVLRVYLKFDELNQPVIHEITRVSRPGRRVFVGKDEIPLVKNGVGCAVLSTSRGVLNDSIARESQIGGEVLFTVW